MRNVDKIKALETDLGRHRKKIEDQKTEIEKLKQLVETYAAGAEQTNVLVDAVMAAVAQKYGIVVRGEDDYPIGYRLELDDFTVDRMKNRFQVHAQKRGTAYIIGAMLKEDKNDDRSDETEAGA